jgi:hypothetical protein
VRLPSSLTVYAQSVVRGTQRIVAPLGVRVDESSPYADATSGRHRVQTRFLGTAFPEGAAEVFVEREGCQRPGDAEHFAGANRPEQGQLRRTGGGTHDPSMIDGAFSFGQ